MKNKPMRILPGACPYCQGDVFIDYKHGARWKCLKNSHYIDPRPLNKQEILSIRRF